MTLTVTQKLNVWGDMYELIIDIADKTVQVCEKPPTKSNTKTN